jgi:hypothetical protein
MSGLRIRTILIVATATALGSRASADEDWGMPEITSVEGLVARPARGGPNAYGAGLDVRIVPEVIRGYFAVSGGFSVTPRSAPVRTDTFLFGFEGGIRPRYAKGDLVLPYVGATIRVLAISHYTDVDRDRFTTLGVGGTAGIMGDLPCLGLFYRVSATVLVASTPDAVPGITLLLGAGIGTRFGF